MLRVTAIGQHKRQPLAFQRGGFIAPFVGHGYRHPKRVAVVLNGRLAGENVTLQRVKVDPRIVPLPVRRAGNHQLVTREPGGEIRGYARRTGHGAHRLLEGGLEALIHRLGKIEMQRVVRQQADVAAGGERERSIERVALHPVENDRNRDLIVIPLRGHAGDIEARRYRPGPAIRYAFRPADFWRDAALARRTPVGFPAGL